ncbi:MAG: metallophosphoesterase [Gemmataceae bacterium]|nr:metallophosphoesterase [Gemmataceae bacterium]
MNWLPLLLLPVAWIGHAFALTVALNIAYSCPVHRRFLRTFRLLIGIAVFSFAFAFPWWIDRLTHGPLRLEPITAWLAICLFSGLIILPVQTLRRNLRREPAVVASRQASLLDLRGQPLGFGKHWRLARLPFNELLEVEVSDLTLRLPRLPAAWDGLTILHLTDLHFHGTPTRTFFDAVIDHLTQGPTPDLVCLTGDYVDTVRHMFWIKPLLGRLQWNVAGLAVLGNHDFYCRPSGVRRELRRAGYRVLGNDWTQLEVRGQPLLAIGNETPWFRPESDLAGAPDGPFRLCLSHSPDAIGWAKSHRVDLMLAGHVHGGQVRVPVVGSLFVPSRYSRKYDCGVFHEAPTTLHVGRGLSGREPLRWNCRPEVSRLTLRPAR